MSDPAAGISTLNGKEAAETINAVNARYGYKPEFHEIYARVGVAIASKNIVAQIAHVSITHVV